MLRAERLWKHWGYDLTPAAWCCCRTGRCLVLPGAGPSLPALATQVALDRAGFSPGEIDGRAAGSPSVRAKRSPARHAAIEPAAEPLVQYTITETDAAGPFVDAIRRIRAAGAVLETLAYTSLVEALAERFHASPALLKALNPTVSFAAGATISVPNVEPFAFPTRQGERPSIGNTSATAASIELARHAGGHCARCVGRRADLRTGDGWQRQDPFRRRLEDHRHIRHAGLQLQPRSVLGRGSEPRQSDDQGRTEQSCRRRLDWPRQGSLRLSRHAGTVADRTHAIAGCVRMTNWDAEKLASLVTEGMPVKLR